MAVLHGPVGNEAADAADQLELVFDGKVHVSVSSLHAAVVHLSW